MVSMSSEWEEKKWMCGGGGGVNLCRVASIVRDRRGGRGRGRGAGGGSDSTGAGPSSSSSSSPFKGRKILKPDKWRAAFDSEGRPVGFQKALKTIIYGGVDESIRAEVWEYLLGCYALSSTAEYRQQLRISRRKRYRDLIDQCQMMHSSIGTGSLAYTVGSKVMDVRIMSKDSAKKEAKVGVERITQEARSKLESSRCMWNSGRIEASVAYENDRQSSTDSTEFGSARENPIYTTLNSSYGMSSAGLDSGVGSESEIEHDGTLDRQSSFDFPYLPVTNLFERSETVEIVGSEAISPRQQIVENTDHNSKGNGNKGRDSLLEDAIHILENDSKTATSNVESAGKNHIDYLEDTNYRKKDKFTLAKALVQEQVPGIDGLEHQPDPFGRMKISDAPELGDSPLMNPVVALGVNVNEDRVADWLWTLHRIVVDVVRTDRHLEFYGDAKNMARMSDILAVYAWVDPMTGYCQGMSDLLSPFIVLFEDDADAFWCFESLLRRMRPNFQMEGPIGVMKQLEALGRILQLTDLQLFKHLAQIGAESLLFAFRMLLVLFRRELSFDDALCMWEMMWAADFDEAMSWALENNCLEPLVLRPPNTLHGDTHVEYGENTPCSKSDQSEQLDADISVSGNSDAKYLSRSPLCGLRPGSFWPKQSQQQICTMSSLLKKNGDDELSVFCVAAILVLNRSKFIKEIHSMDDAIKMFNDMPFEIKVKRCIQMAIKLRKKYVHKLTKKPGIGRSSAKQSS